MTGYYDIAAVSRGLWHFLAGKSFTMASALTVTFVVASALEMASYAVYVSLQALVVLAGRVSGIGVQKVMHRYLPELRAVGDNQSAYRLLWQGTLIRAVLVGLLLGMGCFALPMLGRMFDLNDWLWLVPWYLLVGFLRLMAQWIAAMLESFLWQREAQYPVAVVGVLKLAAVLLFLGDLDLALVVAIDLGSEALMLALLLTAWIWRWRADPARLRGTENWWHANKTRVLQFGIWGFLQNQCGVLYGSAPNRLVAAHYLPTTEVALYGLADNLSNLMRRFMPTQLFIGLIRPVAMAKFSATGDFTPLAWMANLVYRLNLSILVLGIALLTTVGEPLLGAFTGGKYASSALLIAGMFVLIASEGMRSLMELMAQAVERNQVLFFTNLVQSASLILSIPLLPTIGLWALIVANLSGTVLANFLVLYHLRRGGYRFRLSLGHVASVIAYGLASGALGAWLAAMDLHFLVAALGVGGLYIALMLFRPPLDPDERKTLLTLLHYKIAKRSARQRPGAVPAEGEARP